MNDAPAALIRILADGGGHSGESLRAALGVEGADLERLLKSLPRLGLELSRPPGGGGRLAQSLCLLNPGHIRSTLDAPAPALIVLDQVDSTNAELRRRAAAGSEDPLVCLAEYQSAGRGRHQRTWVSPFAHGLCLSVLWRCAAGASGLGGLSLALGVAVKRALADLGLSGIALKWPNDVLARGRKLGGILIEVQGGIPCQVIAGIGLNWRLSAAQGRLVDQPWIDLDALAAGSPPDRNLLAGCVIRHALAVIEEFAAAGLAPFLDEWRAADALLGKSIAIAAGSEEISGRGLGVDTDGHLLVATAGGRRRISGGQVRMAAHAE